jgi:hypothetical protein
VLIAIIKKELNLEALLYTCLQSLSVSIFEEAQLSCALHSNNYNSEPPFQDNQLILCDF